MRRQISTYLDHTITFLLLLVAGLTPLLFLNQTTEFYEMPKLAFLVVVTTILVGLWIISGVVKGKIVITRTPLDIPLLLLLGVVVLSTYFSVSKEAAMYGNFPKVHGSAVAWITYIVLYFVTVSNLKKVTQLKSLLYMLYGSGVVIALITLSSFFHIFLPFDFAKTVNFTPTGSSFSTIAFLLLLLPLPLLSLFNPKRYLSVPLAVALSTLFGVTIVVIGSLASVVSLVIALALCLFVAKPERIKKSFALFLIPVVVIAITLTLAYLPLPQPFNAVQQLEANFPKEIQLPFAISWKITASAFRDAPFIGSGPSSYVFNFTSYKPVEFNLLKFWNFSFDTAYNEFLQTLGTLGIVGLLALVSLCLVVARISWKKLSFDNPDAHLDNTHVLVPALAISGLLSIFLLAIHATTLVSLVMTLLIFALLMVSQKSIRDRVTELSMGLKASTSDNKQFDLFPVIILIVFVITAVPLLYRTFTVVAADYYHRLALSQANKNGTLTYQYLQKAEALNPKIDLYRVDMAQTNFALANAIAAKQKPGENTLTDQEKKTIQALLSQAINESRASVALSPRSPRNWEVLASIYRNITGVAQNALTFSLDAYGQAIQRDPLNPLLRINVGGIYYAAKNYDLAIRFFTDAANLKPDYANAYFNLAIALRDKGDLQNASLVAQQAVTLLQKDTNSPDYKIASKLLADLKASIGTGKQATGEQTNIASGSAALQNPNLSSVNVSNLQKPPQVTPAPSIKPNPNAKVPQIITPYPSPTNAAPTP